CARSWGAGWPRPWTSRPGRWPPRWSTWRRGPWRPTSNAASAPSPSSTAPDRVPSPVMPDPALMEQIVNLCKRRGFVFPSAEIYGGFRSTYDYGPLGVLMLRNVKEAWWRSMVQLRDDVV